MISMTPFLALLTGAAAPAEAIVLKEKARVEGRWIRLTDLLDAEATGPAAKSAVAEVWLGRAPEEGSARTVTADEVRSELSRRGLDAKAFEIRGERVEVTRGSDPEGDPLRNAIAFEIKRDLLDRDAGLQADELTVRLLQIHPASAPSGAEVLRVKPAGAGYTVVLGEKGKELMEAAVLVRILRRRDVAFAVREIASGKVLDLSDLDIRRVETSGDEGYADPSFLVGAATVARLPKGAPVAQGGVRLKPLFKKGDLVRAVSPSFEVDARALEHGAPGQVIAIEFASTRNRARARVVNASRVEVTEEIK